jgi:predicted lipoprotein with Yx(FWY)xxD motif
VKVLAAVLVALALVTGAQAERPPTLKAGSSSYGKVLFDGRGFVLYAFTRDKGKSACYGACAKAWPPYFAPKGTLRVGAGLKRSLLGTVTRKNGKRQVTYAGKPLYYYVGDTRAGQILCQDVVEFGGRWLIVRPSGKLVR